MTAATGTWHWWEGGCPPKVEGNGWWEESEERLSVLCTTMAKKEWWWQSDSSDRNTTLMGGRVPAQSGREQLIGRQVNTHPLTCENTKNRWSPGAIYHRYYSALHIWLNTCIFSNCLSWPNIMTNLTKFSKPDKISSLSPTPMALTCSKDLRGQVVKWCEEYGYSYKKLAELAGCSNGTISNILQYQQLYSQSTHPFSQCPGRTQIFYHTDVALFTDYCRGNAVSIWMRSRQNSERIGEWEISIVRVHHEIAHLDITHKSIS